MSRLCIRIEKTARKDSSSSQPPYTRPRRDIHAGDRPGPRCRSAWRFGGGFLAVPVVPLPPPSGVPCPWRKLITESIHFHFQIQSKTSLPSISLLLHHPHTRTPNPLFLPRKASVRYGNLQRSPGGPFGSHNTAGCTIIYTSLGSLSVCSKRLNWRNRTLSSNQDRLQPKLNYIQHHRSRLCYYQQTSETPPLPSPETWAFTLAVFPAQSTAFFLLASQTISHYSGKGLIVFSENPPPPIPPRSPDCPHRRSLLAAKLTLRSQTRQLVHVHARTHISLPSPDDLVVALSEPL